MVLGAGVSSPQHRDRVTRLSLASRVSDSGEVAYPLVPQYVAFSGGEGCKGTAQRKASGRSQDRIHASADKARIPTRQAQHRPLMILCVRKEHP